MPHPADSKKVEPEPVIIGTDNGWLIFIICILCIILVICINCWWYGILWKAITAPPVNTIVGGFTTLRSHLTPAT